MAALHFTTIHCEPNTVNRAQRKLCFFDEIRPCTNNIVFARLEVLEIFLWVVTSLFIGFLYADNYG